MNGYSWFFALKSIFVSNMALGVVLMTVQLMLMAGLVRPTLVERRLLLSEEFDSLENWEYVVTSYRMDENQFQYYTRRPENR